MSMTAGLHTEDFLNKHPLKVKFIDWGHSKHDTYTTLSIGQFGEGEVTVYVRHSMYADFIAGLEDASRQLREIVAKEMVMTWGFPVSATKPPETKSGSRRREALLIALDELFKGEYSHHHAADEAYDLWATAQTAFQAAISELQCPDGCDESCRCYQEGLEARREGSRA